MIPVGPGGRRLREAVRAVVIDGRDRVLVRLALAEGPLWAASGGGIDDGERPEEAIRRELYEEVGLVDVDLGPMIWTRTHWFPLSSDFDGQRETFSPAGNSRSSMRACCARAPER